jgi:hypothetical protein
VLFVEGHHHCPVVRITAGISVSVRVVLIPSGELVGQDCSQCQVALAVTFEQCLGTRPVERLHREGSSG